MIHGDGEIDVQRRLPRIGIDVRRDAEGGGARAAIVEHVGARRLHVTEIELDVANSADNRPRAWACRSSRAGSCRRRRRAEEAGLRRGACRSRPARWSRSWRRRGRSRAGNGRSPARAAGRARCSPSPSIAARGRCGPAGRASAARTSHSAPDRGRRPELDIALGGGDGDVAGEDPPARDRSACPRRGTGLRAGAFAAAAGGVALRRPDHGARRIEREAAQCVHPPHSFVEAGRARIQG